MSQVLACCLIAGSLFLAASFTLQSQTRAVAIFMVFETNPSAASLSEMETEASHLLKSRGLDLDWKLLSDNDGKKAFPALAVMRFKGNCRIDVQEHLDPAETAVTES